MPDDKNQVMCMYCGFNIIVREAITASEANVENLLRLAARAESTGNYHEAYVYFTRSLEFDSSNYRALIGKGINSAFRPTPKKRLVGRVGNTHRIRC